MIPKIVVDGHFYSPLVDPAEIEARTDRIWPAQPTAAGIDFDVAGHRRLLSEAFARFMPDFAYPEQPRAGDAPGEFHIGNGAFGNLDCRALYVLLRHWRPRRLIEVGSGFSTLLVADVNRRYLENRMAVTAIEPFPLPFLSAGIPGLTRLLASRVQDVDITLFSELAAGDILFIDSSHVAKTGSDVNFLVFEVLPRLAPGVRIHIHDIFLPQDYPRQWVLEGRHWNEQYLVHALLMDSHGFRVVFGCNFAFLELPDELSSALGGPALPGGSLWIEKI